LKAPVLSNTPIYTPLPTPIPICEHVWPAGTEPLVHVRTMVYNHEKYLRTCLDSILMQKTTFPVRMIIHDDASTDSSRAILKEYAERHPNIITVYFQPQNTYQIKDKALLLKKRKPFNDLRVACYEAICEGDDYWTDEMKLQYQADFLETHPEYAGVAHATIIQNEDGREAVAEDFWALYTEDVNLTLADIVQKQVPFHTSSFFFRSHVIPRILNFPFRAQSADLVTFCTVAMEGKIRYIHRAMSVYRTHARGITTIENHFSGLPINLNRYQMWHTLKQYALNKHQSASFDKMLRYQFKYITKTYTPKNIQEWLAIVKVIYHCNGWRGIKVFLKNTLQH
jgi:glycosyltransferase involved in cell wall biosynthesis